MSLYDRLTGLRRELGMIGVFSLFMNLLMLTAPIYMLQVFDRVLASGRVETLFYLTLIAAVALATYGLLEVVRGRMLSRLAGWVDGTLSPDILRAGMARALAGEDSGSRGLAELGQVRSFLGGNGINALFDAPWLPLFVAVIWLMHPLLGMVALTGAVLLFGLALLNELTTRAPVSEAGREARRDEERADAMIHNAHVVRGMGMAKSLMTVWRQGRSETIATLGKAQERNATFVGLSKALRLYLQVAILGVGAYLVLGNEITAGGMIAASILLSRALAPVEQSIGAWKQFIGARNAFRSLTALAEAAPVEEHSVSLPTPEGRLDIEQVAWAPPGADRPILSQVSFGLQPGQTCGVIGPSASGKSTLCRMIVGAWRPSRGVIRLDGADVSRWDADDLGRHVGYLPQSVDLFPGTVAQNIARMGNAAAEEIVRAAQLAGAHDMIVRLPEGYETDIGGFGERLSGGQRQRLGLARALFGRPRLLVLDEPNANLDHEGEEALLEVIRAAKSAGTTVVLVSHRAHILRDVDRIAVLDGGTLKMFGQREDVLSQLRPQRATPVPAASADAARA